MATKFRVGGVSAAASTQTRFRVGQVQGTATKLTKFRVGGMQASIPVGKSKFRVGQIQATAVASIVAFRVGGIRATSLTGTTKMRVGGVIGSAIIASRFRIGQVKLSANVPSISPYNNLRVYQDGVWYKAVLVYWDGTQFIYPGPGFS